MNNKLLIL